MKTPALPPAPLSTSNPPPMVLWFRANRETPWRQVACGSGQDCANAIGVVERAGDWQTLPAGAKPKPDFRG